MGWKKAEPSCKDVRQGIEWLLGIAFQNQQKEDTVGEILKELALRRVVSCEILRDVLGSHLHNLQDLKMDFPRADVFFFSLIAKLLKHSRKDFCLIFLGPLRGLSHELIWDLLLGVFKEVGNSGGHN